MWFASSNAVWLLQAERKREKQAAKRAQDREDRERRRTDTRHPKEGPKRGGSAPSAELEVPLALDDVDLVLETTHALHTLEVRLPLLHSVPAPSLHAPAVCVLWA